MNGQFVIVIQALNTFIICCIASFFFLKPNRKYCEDHKDCESELRQILGPQPGSTQAGSPI